MQVCWWDDRKGGKPEGEINLSVSHIEPVYKTMWISSKTASEFFTASTDGTVGAGFFRSIYCTLCEQVLWWDIRKFNNPVERLVLDPKIKDDDGSTEKVGLDISFNYILHDVFLCIKLMLIFWDLTGDYMNL